MLACTLDANVLYKGYSGKCCWSLYYVLVCDFMLTHYFLRYRYKNKNFSSEGEKHFSLVDHF